MESIEAVVIGAGVVGLACARALAGRGFDTVILERQGAFGTETSARNSEVIHAGLYYPAASLKARLCVAGRRQLYEFCATHAVGHRRCGKLIVATSPDQERQLATLQRQGDANGVDDLQRLSAAEARALEPELAGPWEDMIEQVAVRRGSQPMPVGAELALTLPRDGVTIERSS